MDLVQALDLRRLAADRGAARASVFLPTTPGGLAAGENRIRLENLLRHVENSFVRDEASAEAEALVNGVRRVIDDEWLVDAFVADRGVAGPARSSTVSAAVPRIARSPCSSTSIVLTASCGT